MLRASRRPCRTACWALGTVSVAARSPRGPARRRRRRPPRRRGPARRRCPPGGPRGRRPARAGHRQVRVRATTGLAALPAVQTTRSESTRVPSDSSTWPSTAEVRNVSRCTCPPRRSSERTTHAPGRAASPRAGSGRCPRRGGTRGRPGSSPRSESHSDSLEDEATKSIFFDTNRKKRY